MWSVNDTLEYNYYWALIKCISGGQKHWPVLQMTLNWNPLGGQCIHDSSEFQVQCHDDQKARASDDITLELVALRRIFVGH